MKEATGELNMTVVTVVAIAAIGAFFYAFVWPAIKNSIISSTLCADAICSERCTGDYCDCTAITDAGVETEIRCKAQSDV